jgi:para-aminobenzoate synthetase component 1
MNYVFVHDLSHPEAFAQKLLQFVSAFEPCIILDSNNYSLPVQEFGTYDLLAATGKKQEFTGSGNTVLNRFKNTISTENNWFFGYFGYDLKNTIEKLNSRNFDGLEFPDFYFFKPELVFIIRGKKVEIHSDEKSPEHLYPLFLAIEKLPVISITRSNSLTINHRIPINSYINNVREIQLHIARGDIYEINYCQEFFAENVNIIPFNTYLALNSDSPAPFSSYMAFDHKHLICGSPERFLKKMGNLIVSQPIKGTIQRGENETEDNMLRRKLFSDPKERAENIMIVDLMRNDLSKTAVKGSVRVEELCGIYTFSHWHQMISTIISRVEDDCNPIDIIMNAFPMGSMTGAPKVKAMQLIEEYELTRRGLFSGAVGYFSPDGNFDFNVVIRSILYNAKNKYLSYQTGSAITALSEPENEYRECLLKAKGMLKVLKGD